MLIMHKLYSFVAQTDNRLSARIAAFTGRDSTSMKILAFITTLFLPGTFVAVSSDLYYERRVGTYNMLEQTLFSMNMFDWQQDPASGSVVSPRFWIYWAVTVPLCFLTLSGWAIWWGYEKRRYDVDVADTLLSADTLHRVSWFEKLSKKKRQDGSKEEHDELETGEHNHQSLRQRLPWSNRHSKGPLATEVFLERGPIRARGTWF